MCSKCHTFLYDSIARPFPANHDYGVHYRPIRPTEELVDEFRRILLLYWFMPPTTEQSSHLLTLLLEAGILRKRRHANLLVMAKVWLNVKYYEIGSLHKVHSDHSGGFDWKEAGALSRDYTLPGLSNNV